MSQEDHGIVGDETWLSTAEVSRELDIPRAAVRKLMLEGVFDPLVRNGRGHFRVHRRQVQAFDRSRVPNTKRRSNAVSDSELFWLYDQDI